MPRRHQLVREAGRGQIGGGANRAAEHLVALQDAHAPALAREQRGTRQRVDAGTHEDRVEARHGAEHTSRPRRVDMIKRPSREIGAARRRARRNGAASSSRRSAPRSRPSASRTTPQPRAWQRAMTERPVPRPPRRRWSARPSSLTRQAGSDGSALPAQPGTDLDHAPYQRRSNQRSMRHGSGCGGARGLRRPGRRRARGIAALWGGARPVSDALWLFMAFADRSRLPFSCEGCPGRRCRGNRGRGFRQFCPDTFALAEEAPVVRGPRLRHHWDAH